MKILCRTTFDITCTGVTGNFRPGRIPFRDRAGHDIIDESTWHRARNQQRNWETITQLIQLRAQVQDLDWPTQHNGIWSFEFAVETPDVFRQDNDALAVLYQDCDGVPMLINLDETAELAPQLVVFGNNSNIWFYLAST
jgi:hypothetical protein